MGARYWALVAYGRSEQVELALDQSLDSPTTYELSITLPSVDLRFTVPDPGVVSTLRRFLAENYNHKGLAQIDIGALDGMPVRVIKDDEYADRIWLSTGRDGGVQVCVDDPAARHLVRAVEDLVRDMNTE